MKIDALWEVGFGMTAQESLDNDFACAGNLDAIQYVPTGSCRNIYEENGRVIAWGPDYIRIRD